MSLKEKLKCRKVKTVLPYHVPNSNRNEINHLGHLRKHIWFSFTEIFHGKEFNFQRAKHKTCMLGDQPLGKPSAVGNSHSQDWDWKFPGISMPG